MRLSCTLQPDRKNLALPCTLALALALPLPDSVAAAGFHESGVGHIVIDTQDLPALIPTTEDKDYGILGESTDGGDVGITSASTVSTTGSEATGIRAATSGSGRIDILNTGDLRTTGWRADGILASGSGEIEIDNRADIHTSGTMAHGIRASQGGSADTVIRNTGNLQVDGNAGGWFDVMAGISVSSYSSGAVDVIHNGDILVTGKGVGGGGPMGAFGIFTHTRGTAVSTITASGDITVTGNDPVTAPTSPYQTGIENRAEYGTASINYTNGTLTAAGTTGTRGLVAWSSNKSAGTEASVNVGLDGSATTVNAYGSGSFGVLASSWKNSVRIGRNAGVLGETGIQIQGVDNTFENDGRIVASGANHAAVAVYAYRGNGTVTLTNTGHIEGAYGVWLGGADGNTMDGGTLYNSGTILSTGGDDGIAIGVSGKNIAITLDTGSDITGRIHSTGTGNTLTLQGTATETAAFSSSSAENRFSLTVQGREGANAHWTLNGNLSQLAGVGAVAINNATGPVRAPSTGKLTIRPGEAGDYTFDHALSGNGTLRIELADTTGRIAFSENTGSAFTGIFELGSGTFAMGGAAGSQGHWNALALSNGASGLLLDNGNRFTVTGAQGIGSGGLTINDGAVFELVFNAEGTGSLTMAGGLLDIGSGALLEITLDGYTVLGTETFDIITGADALTVAGGSFAAGTLYELNGFDFYIHHVGNDIILSATPVPEPATCALIAASFVLLGTALLRRR
ncbi:hypothetical protein OPIT5_09430 [Opitutaceae bacterium TAV5]|nr:hypothetical protein OPIT5_09430 [Opitutaceae bacterium TAV5]